MRCKACDRILDDTELTRKDERGNFIDMCGTCLYASGAVEVDSDSDFVENYRNKQFTDNDFYDTLT